MTLTYSTVFAVIFYGLLLVAHAHATKNREAERPSFRGRRG